MTRWFVALLLTQILVQPVSAQDAAPESAAHRSFSESEAENDLRFGTPHGTWLTAVQAIRRRDWRNFSDCLTRDAHADLTFELSAALVIADAMQRSAPGGDWTEDSGDLFEVRLERNLVAMCSRWIPAARREAGEPLGRRPEEQSLNDVDRLEIVKLQLERFFQGLDLKRTIEQRRLARRDFVRAFPNRSQLMGILAELISFTAPDHEFPLPVSGAFQSFRSEASQADAQLPGTGGVVAGTVEFQRLASRTAQWRISSLRMKDPAGLYQEIRQHLNALKEKQPVVSRTDPPVSRGTEATTVRKTERRNAH